ncbi:MAG: hypothetical protein ACRYFW_14795 [Janthinobacterium lividum]
MPLYFVTFAGARAATALTEPVFDFVPFQRAVYQALRHRGLSGILSFEFDIVRRRPPMSDFPVLFHGHGVVQPIDSDAFVFADVRDSLGASPAFPRWDGATGAHIKRIQPRCLDVHRVAAYLADPFHQLKRLQPHRTRPGQRQLRSTRDGLTPALALRATELQSHLSVRDTVFGVGELGQQLRAAWLRRLFDYLPREAGQGAAVSPGEVAGLWAHLRRLDGSDARWGPAQLRTRSSAYRNG